MRVNIYHNLGVAVDYDSLKIWMEELGYNPTKRNGPGYHFQKGNIHLIIDSRSKRLILKLHQDVQGITGHKAVHKSSALESMLKKVKQYILLKIKTFDPTELYI